MSLTRIVADRRADKPRAARPAPARAAEPEREPGSRRHAAASWAFGLMILAAAMQALGRNRLRSALTMLGVFIGFAALIMMVAVGQAAFGQDQDDVVMLPFTTAQERVLGTAMPTAQRAPFNWPYPPWPNPYGLQLRITGYVNRLCVQATSPAAADPAMAEVTQTLMVRHQIQPGAIQDFSVHNLSRIAASVQGSSHIMALLLAALASISPLVGGIGIMNILLVSVTERTREIGLRMAIGARRLHVLLQFLAESVFLSVTGGVAGIVLGAIASEAITIVAGWAAPVSALAIAGGFFFSALVGVFFGYYPARKAARLDPMEALRHE